MRSVDHSIRRGPRLAAVAMVAVLAISAALTFAATKKKTKPADPSDTGTATPPTVEMAQKKLWGKLSDDEQASAIEQLKQFTMKTKKGKEGALHLLETKYFLFYSDIKPKDAENWASLLDKMYARLAELFAVPKGENIWRGKALVIVLSKAADYRDLLTTTYKVDPGESIGMCHSFGNGLVHINFFRQPKDLDFAHVLVHESTHGFVHRYRSPVFIPSWANEGLAEVIAFELVPQQDRYIANHASAQASLRAKGMGTDFFTIEHIEGWQYPVAHNFAKYMIEQSKTGYVSFINSVKDGVSVEDALATKYGASRDRIVDTFMEQMGAKQQLKKGKGK